MLFFFFFSFNYIKIGRGMNKLCLKGCLYTFLDLVYVHAIVFNNNGYHHPLLLIATILLFVIYHTNYFIICCNRHNQIYNI